ncbi:MAG: Ig-like domain-containing protein [Gemmatimonadetes bacterium]|nr:Ig-like domain-containing protein [Gemmatimonadota bacterium]
MNRQKSGILGLALSLALIGVACEDKTEVVIPPPADPPIEVSVTPPSQTVNVGSTATFVAQVTGGNETTVRTVTWSSSNTAVAGNPNANGTTTCLTAGTTTIAATATALASARAAATLECVTPPPPPTPTVSIKSITMFATNVPVALNNVFGQIDITLNFENPAGSLVTALRTYVRKGTTDTLVCEQTFSGTAGEAGVGADEALGEVEIICSVNTAVFTGTPGVDNAATVTFGNGPGYKVRVEIVRSGGTVAAQIESGDMTFNNTSFIVAQRALPTNCKNNPTTGLVWCEGDVQYDFLPVGFSTNANDAVASVTLTAFVAVPAVGAPTRTDAAGPFSVNLPKASSLASNGVASVEDPGVVLNVNSLTVGGQPGPACINPDPVLNPFPVCGVATPNLVVTANPFRLDNWAPRVTNFDVTPLALCPGSPAAACYLGPIFAFANAAVIVQSGLSFYNDIDAGVTGQTRVFSAGIAGSEVTATTGTSLSTANGGPGESPVPNYVVKVVTTDLLGNARTNWAGPAAAVPLTSATGAQLVGYDETIPTHTHLAGPGDMTTNTGIVAGTIGFTDSGVGPSGFLANPVQIRFERVTASGTVCLHPDTGVVISCTAPTAAPGVVADDGNFAYPAVDGYYVLTVYVRDQAWNFSVTTTRFTLQDVTAPIFTGGLVAPATMLGGAAVTIISALSDAVDLGSVHPYVGYGAGATFLGRPIQVIGTFGPSPINGTDPGSVTIPSFIRSVQTTTAAGLPSGTINGGTSVTYAVRDMAGHSLRFTISPWAAAPNDGLCPAGIFPDPGSTTQNCLTRQLDVTANVAAPLGGIFPQAYGFGAAPAFNCLVALSGCDLIGLNGVNPLHGLFAIQAPSAAVICNNSARTSCPASTTPLTTALTVTVTGPASVFLTPFAEVAFYYQSPTTGVWNYIAASGSPLVTDNTLANTRTVTYTATWDATNWKVRPAGAAGTAYNVAAVGRNTTGDALISQNAAVTVHGN